MKTFSSLIFAVLLTTVVSGQVLQLEACFRWVEENHPKSNQKALLDQQLETRINKLDKNFLPHLSLEAQASYQSEVTEVAIDIPGMNPDIPTPHKDQYKASLNLSQTIYDGGVTNTQRQIERMKNKIDHKEVEVALHKIKEHLTTTYFSVLLLQQQHALLRTTKETLESKYAKVQAAIKHGAALPSDTNVMKVELVKLNNELQQLKRREKTAFEVLSELTGQSISQKRVLAVPQYQLNDRTAFTTRPEMQMLSLRQQQAEDYQTLSKRKYFPKVRAFGTAGYGRPGMNMLSEDFSTFWIAGAGLSWELWNWNKSGDEQQELSLRQRILEKEKAHIAKNFSAQTIRKRSEIENLRQQMKEDRQVLQLYEDIVASYASKLDNGTITSAEFIEQLNNRKDAQMQYELHQIQLEKAKVDYNLISGNILARK